MSSLLSLDTISNIVLPLPFRVHSGCCSCHSAQRPKPKKLSPLTTVKKLPTAENCLCFFLAQIQFNFLQNCGRLLAIIPSSVLQINSLPVSGPSSDHLAILGTLAILASHCITGWWMVDQCWNHVEITNTQTQWSWQYSYAIHNLQTDRSLTVTTSNHPDGGDNGGSFACFITGAPLWLAESFSTVEIRLGLFVFNVTMSTCCQWEH